MGDRIEVGTGEGSFWATTYPVAIPTSTGQEVVIRHGFFGGLKVLVDGARAMRGSKRSKSLVPTSDGADLEVTVRPGGWGTAPVLLANETSAQIGRRIEGAEWIWIGLPLLLPAYALLARGGALDILVGFLAFTANVRIFVNDGFSVGARYLYSLGSMGLFAAVYLAISLTIVLLTL